MVTRDDSLSQIEEAFAGVPRPSDEELLHEDCRHGSCCDDMDIQSLYGISHWRDVPEVVVEGEWAALFFLCPAGFRHFLPAYMSWVLRHPDGGAAVVSSTLIALTPATDDLRTFSLSKFTLLNEDQRSAVLSFLEAMAPFEDVTNALAHWRSNHPEAAGLLDHKEAIHEEGGMLGILLSESRLNWSADPTSEKRWWSSELC